MHLSGNSLGFWLGFSLAAAVVGANLAWLAAGNAGGRVGRVLAGRFSAAMTWPGAPALAWLLVALYLLLPPFAAWRSGAVSPYLLGLSEVDWPAALGAPGLLAGGVILLALAGWLVFRRSLRVAAAQGEVRELAAGPRAAGGARLETFGSQVAVPEAPRRWLAPFDAALGQWHAAFYRAIAIAWLAAGAALPPALLDALPAGAGEPVTAVLQSWVALPVYWGSWLGLALLAVEWLLNPFTWRELRTPGRMEGALRAVGLAIATTALFSFTRNLWLCLLCSASVEILIAGWFPLSER